MSQMFMKIIVEYPAQNSAKHKQQSYDIENLRAKKQIVELNELDFENSQYTFNVRWCNEAGKSKPSEYVTVHKDDAIPSAPVNLRVSTKRNSNMIKIQWEEPEENSFAVTNMRYKCISLNETESRSEFSTKCSQTLKDLKKNTVYCFSVRAINSKGYSRPASKEINAETKISQGEKLAKTTGAFFGGMVAGTVVGSIGGASIATDGKGKANCQ